MIEIGQRVKYFLRNGMVLEGFVEKDAASECRLKSLDGNLLFIIHRPQDDILLTTLVLADKIYSENKVVEKNDETDHQQQIRSKLHEVLHPAEDPDLNKLNIAQLRDLVAQQDRKIIQQKTK